MERRKQPIRPRTLKGGRIVFNKNLSTMDCVIRNLTESGARLEVDAPQRIPDRFVLKYEQGMRQRDCEVRWRKANTMGVAFVD